MRQENTTENEKPWRTEVKAVTMGDLIKHISATRESQGVRLIIPEKEAPGPDFFELNEDEILIKIQIKDTQSSINFRKNLARAKGEEDPQ